MIIENRRARAHVDVPLIILVFALAIFGVLAVTVATFSSDSTADASLLAHIIESTYAWRQCIFLAMAPIIIAVLMNVPYEMLKRLTPTAYWGGTVLLLVVWVFNRAAGVKAWLDVIWGFTIQPSEFIKLAMILMLARRFAREERPMSNFKSFMGIGILIGIPCGITLLSGEMGSLLVVIFFSATMMWFGGVPKRVWFSLAGAAVLAVALLYGYMVASGSDSYRLARILAFINPDLYSSTDAYQMTQSKMCIGSGGLTGIGMFVEGAISQLNYVPADWTDFIFATIGEAFGFVGCVSIVVVYFLIILRMLYLATFTRDKFGRMVIIGVMGMLLFHVVENIGMTLGLLPITGIPLPFISYGGSNMVTNMGGVALVLNVTRHRSLSHAVSAPQTMVNAYAMGHLNAEEQSVEHKIRYAGGHIKFHH